MLNLYSKRQTRWILDPNPVPSGCRLFVNAYTWDRVEKKAAGNTVPVITHASVVCPWTLNPTKHCSCLFEANFEHLCNLQAPPTNLERPVSLGEGLYVCGDHREAATLEGALRSGLRAADAILSAWLNFVLFRAHPGHNCQVDTQVFERCTILQAYAEYLQYSHTVLRHLIDAWDCNLTPCQIICAFQTIWAVSKIQKECKYLEMKLVKMRCGSKTNWKTSSDASVCSPIYLHLTNLW